MNLTDYLRILVRRGWIIVLAVILTAGSGYVFSRLQTKVYRSTEKIMIKPARNDFGLTQTLRQLLESYSVRMNTDLRAKEVIDTLKLDMTPQQLSGAVNVTPDLNSMVL